MAAEPFRPGAFRDALAAVPWVREVVAMPECGSTNDEALRAARDGAEEGTVFVADRQTAGRGRRGRTWWSEPGTALLTSWIVRPTEPMPQCKADETGRRIPLETERWTILPLLAGIAAAEGIEASCGVRVGLKWPNDLMAGERKLGGILAEAEVPRFVVVGLGVNVASVDFPDDIAGIATSVAAAGGRPPGRPAILASIMSAFGSALAGPDAALHRYRERCVTLGLRVRVEGAGKPVTGVAREVGRLGELLVETAAGPRSVAAGEVVNLRPDSEFRSD